MAKPPKVTSFVKGVGPLILLVLTVTSMSPLITSVQAFRRFPPPVQVCFAVFGTSPQGVIYYAYFYRRAMATHLAAGWIAAGWTHVIIVGGVC